MKTYENPDFVIEKLEAEDVITTSVVTCNNDLGDF